jgi:hypothetical protein
MAVIAISVALILMHGASPPGPASGEPSPIPAQMVSRNGPLSPPDCRGSATYQAAASDNAASFHDLDWAPLGVQERGWETYAPLIAHEIGSGCAAQSPAFAQDLAGWQGRHGLPVSGRMTPETFAALYRIWHARRPFSRVLPSQCPDPPPASDMAEASAAEAYGGKSVRLRRDALAALRRMIAAARAEDPRIGGDAKALTIFSGFRDPSADMARCLADGACDGRRRTWCSAHRTGTAVDLYLGAAPGFGPDSTAPESRLYLSHTPAYRWLVANAGRFGFVNYVYEPWHWEWTGDQDLTTPAA